MPPSVETIVKAIERVLLSPRVAATVFFVSAAMLFGSRLLPGVSPLAQQYHPWIWVFLLISGFYTLTFPVQWLAHAVNRKLKGYRVKRDCIRRLHSLNVKEKHILQWHVENANGVETWSVNRMEINSLAYDGLLISIQQVGNTGYFKIPDEARRYLLQHPDLIATPDNPRPPRSKNEWMI